MGGVEKAFGRRDEPVDHAAKTPDDDQQSHNGHERPEVEDLEKIASLLNRDIKFFIGQEGEQVDIRTALRADKDLNDKDKEAIIRFVELAKQKKNGN